MALEAMAEITGEYGIARKDLGSSLLKLEYLKFGEGDEQNILAEM